jgi:Tol biopolymer transport system component
MNQGNESKLTNSNQIIFDSLIDRSDGVDSSREHRLLALNVADLAIKQIFADKSGMKFQPSFNPATERVAITHYEEQPGADPSRPKIIFVSVKGEPDAHLPNLQSARYYSRAATFSPDGKYLALEVDFDRANNPNIWIFEGADTIFDTWVACKQIALIENPARIGVYAPRFFPEGKRIVYLRNYSYEDDLELCLTDLTKTVKRDVDLNDEVGNLERLFGVFPRRRLTNNADVVWRRTNALALHAPSDTALFIRGHWRHKYQQVCTVQCSADVHEDPLAISAITENFEHIEAIALSPDGLQAAFDGDGRLYVAAPDGGDLIQLTAEDDGKCHCFAFSPDSKHLAFAMSGGVRGSGIWRMDRFGEGDQRLATFEGRVREMLWI